MPCKLVPASVMCMDTCSQRGAHLSIDQASRQLQIICNILRGKSHMCRIKLSSAMRDRGLGDNRGLSQSLGTGDNTCSIYRWNGVRDKGCNAHVWIHPSLNVSLCICLCCWDNTGCCLGHLCWYFPVNTG